MARGRTRCTRGRSWWRSTRARSCGCPASAAPPPAAPACSRRSWQNKIKLVSTMQGQTWQPKDDRKGCKNANRLAKHVHQFFLRVTATKTGNVAMQQWTAVASRQAQTKSHRAPVVLHKAGGVVGVLGLKVRAGALPHVLERCLVRGANTCAKNR